jgi:hypothetical protein
MFLILQNTVQNLFKFCTNFKKIFKFILDWSSANLRLCSVIIKDPDYKENLAIPEVISGKTLSAV